MEFKLVRPYFYGDYYPLTGPDNLTQDNNWLAYQLNRTSVGDGIIVAFRRKDCSVATITVKLHGVDTGGNYLLYNEDTKVNESLSGEVLRNGYTLNIADKPGSVLIMYKKVP
jgi:alpha-galactosidase